MEVPTRSVGKYTLGTDRYYFANFRAGRPRDSGGSQVRYVGRDGQGRARVDRLNPADEGEA